MCPPGSLVAAEVSLPASLPKATTEPVKVTAPMKTPRKSSTRRMLISIAVLWATTAAKPRKLSTTASAACRASGLVSWPARGKGMPTSAKAAATRPISIWALKPTKTAARPTRLCIAATSCGISVICTLCAT